MTALGSRQPVFLRWFVGCKSSLAQRMYPASVYNQSLYPHVDAVFIHLALKNVGKSVCHLYKHNPGYKI